ncbi:TPA_asm: G [Ocimum alphacytorhabdovirus 1]|nr:TPA_asm: G [Ocimum alphacytorhabdovirus 1]
MSALLFLFALFVVMTSNCYAAVYKDSDTWTKSVGPIVHCTNETRSIETVIKECYHHCLMDPEPKDRVTLMIKQLKKDTNGPEVVECSKVKLTQTFTMTWTFSTMKSEPTHEFLPVSGAECEEAIKTNCPDRKCNHREKDSLEEEYHYASDTTKTETTISLITMSSIIARDGDVIKISPLSATKFVDVKEGGLKEDLKVYTWNSGYDLKSCPYESTQRYACDSYEGTDGMPYYMCSGGRFSVTPVSKEEPDLTSVCPGLKQSHEGFLYSKADSQANQDKHSRLSITKTQDMDANTDYLRHKIQQIATHLDSEICHNQCEILSLESRVSKEDSRILRIGLDYFKTTEYSSSLVVCKTLHGCRLSEPKTFCGNPPRVGVSCTHISGLWDPTTVELSTGGICLKPDLDERLHVSVGGRLYSVDDNLMIHLNLSGLSGVYPLGFSNLHQSGIQLTVEELGKMRPEWVDNKAKMGGISKTTESSRRINSPSFNIGSKIVEFWKGIEVEFDSIEHYLGGFVIFSACTLAAYGFWKIKIQSLKKMPRKNDTVAIVERQPLRGTKRAANEWI